MSACVENLQIDNSTKSDVKFSTPEVAKGLVVLLGSSVDATRGPSLGMGGVYHLTLLPGLGREI